MRAPEGRGRQFAGRALGHHWLEGGKGEIMRRIEFYLGRSLTVAK